MIKVKNIAHLVVTSCLVALRVQSWRLPPRLRALLPLLDGAVLNIFSIPSSRGRSSLLCPTASRDDAPHTENTAGADAQHDDRPAGYI